MIVTVAALTLMVSLLLHEVGTTVVDFLRLPPRSVVVFWLLIAGVALALAWFGPSEHRANLAEQERRTATTCLVEASEARPHDGGGAERWLKVSWTVDGETFTLPEPIMWWWDVDLTLESALDGYEVGAVIPCRYEPDTPSHIYADGVDAINKHLAALIPIYVGAGFFFLLSVVTLRRPKEYHQPPAPGVRLRLGIQLLALIVAAVSYELADESDNLLFWWAAVAVAVAVWIAIAFREIQAEDRLTSLLADQLEDCEHWPPPPSDSSDIVIDPYGSDRMAGRWNGMQVRIAPGAHFTTMEVDVPCWPRSVFMGPRGSRPSAGDPTGDALFDRHVQLEGLNRAALERLRPDVRQKLAPLLEETGAVLEDGMFTASLDSAAGRITFDNLARVVEVAAMLERDPVSKEQRLAEEPVDAIRKGLG